jgi:hypothetical protein
MLKRRLEQYVNKAVLGLLVQLGAEEELQCIPQEEEQATTYSNKD